MNVVPPLHPPQIRRFTTADVFAMLEAGVLSRDEKLELIEGELYVLSPKHNKHEIYKRRLATHFARALSDGFELCFEQTMYLSDDTFLEPDLMVVPTDSLPEDTRPSDTLLVIEIAHSSLDHDLKRKSRIYAREGAPCLWVVDAEAGVAHVLTEPDEDGYARTRIVDKDEPLIAPFDPKISVRLADLMR